MPVPRIVRRIAKSSKDGLDLLNSRVWHGSSKRADFLPFARPTIEASLTVFFSARASRLLTKRQKSVITKMPGHLSYGPFSRVLRVLRLKLIGKRRPARPHVPVGKTVDEALENARSLDSGAVCIRSLARNDSENERRRGSRRHILRSCLCRRSLVAQGLDGIEVRGPNRREHRADHAHHRKDAHRDQQNLAGQRSGGCRRLRRAAPSRCRASGDPTENEMR